VAAAAVEEVVTVEAAVEAVTAVAVEEAISNTAAVVVEEVTMEAVAVDTHLLLAAGALLKADSSMLHEATMAAAARARVAMAVKSKARAAVLGRRQLLIPPWMVLSLRI
jgi:hypothetical protein